MLNINYKQIRTTPPGAVAGRGGGVGDIKVEREEDTVHSKKATLRQLHLGPVSPECSDQALGQGDDAVLAPQGPQWGAPLLMSHSPRVQTRLERSFF